MSTSESRRSWNGALKDAQDFRAMFTELCYERWEFAGSLRRNAPAVSDIDHVVIPRFGLKPNGGLFTDEVNLLFHRLDELEAAGEVRKHIYGTAGHRWGEKHRGCDWRNLTHEVRCTTVNSFGGALAIYTGPHEFSKRLVTGLLRNNLRNDKGLVWKCAPCDWCAVPTHPATPEKKCAKCNGTKLMTVEAISVPTEEEYFKLCGVPFTPPEDRHVIGFHNGAFQAKEDFQ